MIITIQGKPGEGKTILAKKICKGEKVCFIEEHSLKSPFWTNQLNDDTDFILVDDVRKYEETYSIFRAETITVNRRCKAPFDIKMPNVILVCYSSYDFKNYIENVKSAFVAEVTKYSIKDNLALRTASDSLLLALSQTLVNSLPVKNLSVPFCTCNCQGSESDCSNER